MKRPRLYVLLDSLLVFLLAAALIWPLFKLKYMENWYSIESTFIADARYLAENWPHPRWQPLWYGGTRFDFVYPPALRYGTAALVKLFPPMAPARAYHLYNAIFFCLGIVGIYLLVWTGCRSRRAALLAAGAVLLLSPSFLFMTHIRLDSWNLAPHRLSVLARYGEGPHMSALAALGLALAASMLALARWRPGMFALAALLCALVVSNNFYGANALATFFPVLCWSIYVTHQDRMVWARAAGIAALACGLTAAWLTPSYVSATVNNLKLVSQRGTTWSLYLALAVTVGCVLLTHRWAAGKRERTYTVFVIGAAVFFSLNVLGQYYFKFRVAGEPERLVPELDMVLILLAVEAMRHLWDLKRFRLAARVAIVILIMASFYPVKGFVRTAWTILPKAGDPSGRLEYQIPEWVHQNHPHTRSLTSGSVRFWWNAWFNNAQIGGGSEQGLLNDRTIELQWQVLQGNSPELSIAWMQALGVDLVIVHDETSKELFHDWAAPKQFEGKLPVVWDSQKGDKIYRVPRRYPSLARVVDSAKAASLDPPLALTDLPRIRAYADLVEPEADSLPTTSAWEGPDLLHLRAKVEPGQSIVVQISYDPYWIPHSAGRILPTRKDIMGQILVDAPPGDHDIRLVFERPLENLVGVVLNVLALLISAALVVIAWRRKQTSA